MDRLPDIGNAISGLRVIRSTNGVVALALLLLAIVLVASWAAPLTETQRYVVMGLAFGSAFVVWFFYWRKARGEPLSSTEQYLIAALPYLYGQKSEGEREGHVLTREALLKEDKVEPRALLSAEETD